jgi:hypothetical protein
MSCITSIQVGLYVAKSERSHNWKKHHDGIGASINFSGSVWKAYILSQSRSCPQHTHEHTFYRTSINSSPTTRCCIAYCVVALALQLQAQIFDLLDLLLRPR